MAQVAVADIHQQWQEMDQQGPISVGVVLAQQEAGFPMDEAVKEGARAKTRPPSCNLNGRVDIGCPYSLTAGSHLRLG